jgi:hypothetical protein
MHYQDRERGQIKCRRDDHFRGIFQKYLPRKKLKCSPTAVEIDGNDRRAGPSTIFSNPREGLELSSSVATLPQKCTPAPVKDTLAGGRQQRFDRPFGPFAGLDQNDAEDVRKPAHEPPRT